MDVRFVDELTGGAVDPSTITYYTTNNGVQTPTVTYSGATSPAVGVIARLGAGWYRTFVDTTLMSGDAYGTYEGDGAAQAVGERWFYISPRGVKP